MAIIKVPEFQAIISGKKRRIHFTLHAKLRAIQRQIPEKSVEDDLLSNSPVLIIEDEAEPGERKFNLYYYQFPGTYKKYVISVNDEIRIITVIRTNKSLQMFMAGDRKWK